jgi:hypothetical protein
MSGSSENATESDTRVTSLQSSDDEHGRNAGSVSTGRPKRPSPRRENENGNTDNDREPAARIRKEAVARARCEDDARDLHRNHPAKPAIASNDERRPGGATVRERRRIRLQREAHTPHAERGSLTE